MANKENSTKQTAGELRDKERRNWVKCSLGLQEIAKALRPHADNTFLEYFEKNKFLSKECCHIRNHHSGLCPCKNTKNYCVCCTSGHKGSCYLHTWVDDDHKVRKRRDGKWIVGTTSMPTHRVSVDSTCMACQKTKPQSVSVNDNCKQCHNASLTTKCNACQSAIDELIDIMQNVEIIYWENTDIKNVFDSHWNVAKIFMPKGNKGTENAKEADVACLLAMFHNCKLFKVNRVVIGAMIRKRNEVIHQSEQRFDERTKNEFFKFAIGFLKEFNEIYSCLDQITTMKELQEKEVTAEMFNEADESMIQDLLNEISDRLASGQRANELVERLRQTMKNQAMRIITKEKDDAIQNIERKHQLDLSQINEVITNQKDEIKSLRTVLCNKDEEMKSLKTYNTEIEEKIGNVLEERLKIIAKNDALKESIERLDQQKTKLKLENENLHTTIDKKEKEIERLDLSLVTKDKEIKRLYEKNIEQEQKVKRFQHENLKLKEEKELHEQNFRDEQIKSKEVEKKNEHMRQTINEMEQETGNLKTIVCNKDKELKHLNLVNEELKNKLQSVKIENDNLTQSISRTNETVRKQECELEQIKQRILQLKAENARLEADIGRLERQRNKLRLIVEEVNRLTKDCDAKERETQIIYRRIEETESQRSCKENQKEVQNLQDSISEKGKEFESQKKITCIKDTELKSFQSADMENGVESRKAESQSLDDEFKEGHTRYQDIENEVQQLKQENREEKKKNQTLLEENRELSALLFIGCILSVFVAIWLLRLAMFFN